jgi:hypothetical protein
MTSNSFVQSLWVGKGLSTMERLTISSFLRQGHGFHLYAYSSLTGVPAGTTVLDAAEILPETDIFQYPQGGSVAGFANFFRYKLLLEKGGWWTDMDYVCLTPLDFADDLVFGSEMDRGERFITNSMLKLPPHSAFAEYAWQRCRATDTKTITWGETGPKLAAEAVRSLGLERHVQEPSVFCPLDYRSWQAALDPDIDLQFEADTRAVHLWHEKWRRAGQDHDASYPAGCLYERLKSRYLDS